MLVEWSTAPRGPRINVPAWVFCFARAGMLICSSGVGAGRRGRIRRTTATGTGGAPPTRPSPTSTPPRTPPGRAVQKRPTIRHESWGRRVGLRNRSCGLIAAPPVPFQPGPSSASPLGSSAGEQPRHPFMRPCSQISDDIFVAAPGTKEMMQAPCTPAARRLFVRADVFLRRTTTTTTTITTTTTTTTTTQQKR